MYSLVAAGINHSGICRSFSSHNLTTIFIDSGTYGISANKLPGITIFCIRSPSAPVFTTVSVAIAPDLTACQPFSLMTVPVANPALHAPLLTAVQRGIQCQSLQTLSASFTDYVSVAFPRHLKLETTAADGVLLAIPPSCTHCPPVLASLSGPYSRPVLMVIPLVVPKTIWLS